MASNLDHSSEHEPVKKKQKSEQAEKDQGQEQIEKEVEREQEYGSMIVISSSTQNEQEEDERKDEQDKEVEEKGNGSLVNFTEQFKESDRITIDGIVLPIGFHFSPPEDTLVLHFLLNRILGNKLPSTAILEMNLYEYDAHQLPINEWDHFMRNELYVFTELETPAKRTTKNGYWKVIGGETPIYFRGNTVVGIRKHLTFYYSRPSGEFRSRWIMHEYRISPNYPFLWTVDPDKKVLMERVVACHILNLAGKEEEGDF